MKEFALLIPELILAGVLALLIVAEISYHGERVRLVTTTAALGLAAAMIYTILSYPLAPARAFGGVLSIDGLSIFFKLFFIALALLTLMISGVTQDVAREKKAEYAALVIAASLTMSIAASASDLLVCFLCLQSYHLISYLLAAYGKGSVRSTEAAVKHLSFGVFGGALFLFGSAMLFAGTRTINIYQMPAALASSPFLQTGMLVIVLLLILGWSAQMAAFPMGFWAPDVLQGSPTPASGFIAMGGRAVGFVVAVRVLVVVFAQGVPGKGQWTAQGMPEWPILLSIIAGGTLLYGTFLAVRQSTVKRLVSCLIVAQTGFLLMGLLVLDELGIAASLFNLLVELFAVLGCFYVLSVLENGESMKGALSRALPETVALILFLSCIVGLPPFPGFLGKFTLIGAAVSHEWYSLAVVATLSMILCTVAVFRLMFRLIGHPVESTAPVSLQGDLTRGLILATLVVPLVILGVFAEDALEWAGRSLRFILW